MKKEKDMSKLHSLPKFREVVKRKSATLTDYKNNSQVDMKWGWNDSASLDQVFALRIPAKGDREAVEIFLDWQEVMHYGRAVSDWKYALEEMIRQAEANA